MVVDDIKAESVKDLKFVGSGRLVERSGLDAASSLVVEVGDLNDGTFLAKVGIANSILGDLCAWSSPTTSSSNAEVDSVVFRSGSSTGSGNGGVQVNG